MASGIAAALNYIMAFLTTKTYYNIETSMSLFGLIAFYAVVDVLGLIYIYMFLPETGMCDRVHMKLFKKPFFKTTNLFRTKNA